MARFGLDERVVDDRLHDHRRQCHDHLADHGRSDGDGDAPAVDTQVRPEALQPAALWWGGRDDRPGVGLLRPAGRHQSWQPRHCFACQAASRRVAHRREAVERGLAIGGVHDSRSSARSRSTSACSASRCAATPSSVSSRPDAAAVAFDFDATHPAAGGDPVEQPGERRLRHRCPLRQTTGALG